MSVSNIVGPNSYPLYVSKRSYLQYEPSTPADWTVPPEDVYTALDDLASDGGGGGGGAGTSGSFNAGLKTSVAGNALTLTLTQRDGVSAPTTTNPLFVTFRNASVAVGGSSTVTIESSISLVIPSGASIGCTNSYAGYIYVYAMNNAGVVVLAVSLYPYNIAALASSSAIAGGSVASTLYSAAAHVSLPIQYLGKFKAPQTVAGTWAANSTEIWIATGYDNAASQLLAANGDLLTVVNNVPSRLAVGSYGQQPRSSGSSISWQMPVTGFFGTGLDGDVVKNGVSLFYPNKEPYWHDLTLINSSINTAGLRVFVSGTLDIDGTSFMTYNARDGTTNQAVPTTNGQAGSIYVLAGGSAGGPSGSDPGVDFTASEFGYGGAGGAGGTSDLGAGGVGGVLNSPNAVPLQETGRGPQNIIEAMFGKSVAGDYFWGGSGGGGGANGTSGQSGAGGEGAGVMILFINKLRGSGQIRCNGGNGGAGTGASGSGGGGGGGLLVVVTLDMSEWTGTIVANGGVGGAVATGGVGVSGANGVVYTIQL